MTSYTALTFDFVAFEFGIALLTLVLLSLIGGGVPLLLLLLLPLISSVKVRMGYTKDYVRNEGFVEFFDDVSRLQIIHNADHLLAGCYAGTIDMKKINKKELNWMQEIN